MLLQYFGEEACIYGSFVRKLFDMSLRFSSLKNKYTSNLNFSNINYIYNINNKYDKNLVISQFFKTIRQIEISSSITL